MKPLDYLTSEEIFIWKTIRKDISKSQTRNNLELLASKLDVLLARAIRRYRERNGIG